MPISKKIKKKSTKKPIPLNEIECDIPFDEAMVKAIKYPIKIGRYFAPILIYRGYDHVEMKEVWMVKSGENRLKALHDLGRKVLMPDQYKIVK